VFQEGVFIALCFLIPLGFGNINAVAVDNDAIAGLAFHFTAMSLNPSPA
jgi:hypothetical protein